MEKPSFFQSLARGMRKQCPQCGKAPLFRKWIDRHERCIRCGLVFEEHGGDLWAFWIIGDRIFVVAAVLLAWYLQNSLLSETAKFFIRAGSLMILTFGLIGTMPNRMGACVAMDYLLRKK